LVTDVVSISIRCDALRVKSDALLATIFCKCPYLVNTSRAEVFAKRIVQDCSKSGNHFENATG